MNLDQTSATLKLQRYVDTYLSPPPAQDTESAGTDPQLTSIITQLVAEISNASEGAIIDIGCGRGTLLSRLSEEPSFMSGKWIYVAVDFEEMLAEVHTVARRTKLNRRVEFITLREFQQRDWPTLPKKRIFFCRNVFHELSIVETSELLRLLRKEFSTEDKIVIQDLINFQEGERHNSCWIPSELEYCLQEHGLGKPLMVQTRSKSGAMWFNCIVGSATEKLLSEEESLVSVMAARRRQWQIWSQVEDNALLGHQPEREVMKILDLDVQYAALTRQLLDVGAELSFSKRINQKLRETSLVGPIREFINFGEIKKHPILDTVNFRERGEQLNGSEEFLRSDAPLSIIAGGAGIGKTTFVRHLLSRRAYNKSAVIVNHTSLTDIWAFIEVVFSQTGLNLPIETLSALKGTGWQILEPLWRDFITAYSRDIIFFLDDFHRALDSNGKLADKNLAEAIGVLVKQPGAKIILAQNERTPSSVVEREWGQLDPFTVQLGRFASDNTVINVLDDRVDRTTLGLTEYPVRLISAISRHPLAARLTADILRTQGAIPLEDERFFVELEGQLFTELWKRLVDETAMQAVTIATLLRTPVPTKTLQNLSSNSSVDAGLTSCALYSVCDRRWETLLCTLELFRRRTNVLDISSEVHGQIADEYVSLYKADDDPKWIRESYYHRLLSPGPAQPLLGAYYFRELVASAEYCFRTRQHARALELYSFAGSVGALAEEALMHRASCLVRTGQRPSGDDEYRQLLKTYPRAYGIKLSYVAALIWIREYSEALGLFDELKLDLNDIFTTNLLGRIYLGLHDYEQAEKLLWRVVNGTKVPHVRAYIDLAHALQYQGAVQEERKVLARALHDYPSIAELHAMDGAALLRSGQSEDAIEKLQPLFDLYPEQTSAALTLIKIYGRDKNTRHKSRKIFEKALRATENKENPVLVTMEAEVLKLEGRTEAAVSLLKNRTTLDDQHSLGMYFECLYHYLQQVPPQKRKLEAANALRMAVPGLLRKNVPLQVNRARLAVMADDFTTFVELRDQLAKGRTERFEVDSLDRLWREQKQGS
jgi:tetratricopeptide (TPR) repeat protein